ncbi:MAG TPA: phosphate ABC transporter substrate-binding protein PstS [bacterium]|nr:phosphate ABC transporter substrate-binding protein PstS [bacterium]
MKNLQTILKGALAAAVMTATSLANAGSLNGAGATFPYPIYSKWFYEYNQKTGTAINYQSIGSGGGIQQMTNGTVDFGASDAPLTDEQVAKIKDGCMHFPTVAGAVALAYNVPGVSSGLKLTPAVLADMYMGAITKWNDPQIAEINEGVNLPDLNITVAHRSDGSGTTNIFTNYLTKVSVKWASTVGFGTAVKWPVGVGGKGNEGVAGLISQIPGTIGYVELAYAVKNKLSYAMLKNKSGKYVEPTLASTTAAVAGAKMPPDFRVMITNASGADAYPICGFTWLLIHKSYGEKAADIKGFLNWYLTTGEGMASELYYAPLPSAIIDRVKKKVDLIQ